MPSRKKLPVVVAHDAGLRTSVLCCLSEGVCAAIHLCVEFLGEHGHRTSDAQKLIPFYGIESVTKGMLDYNITYSVQHALLRL